MPSSTGSQQSRLFDTLAKKYPQYKVHFQTANTLSTKVAQAVDSASPFINECGSYLSVAHAKAKQHHVDEYVPLLLGFAICFFGGSYTMLIAVYETVRQLCWEELKRSYKILYYNYAMVLQQNRKDNQVDADGNGVADVEEISREQLISRKVSLFMKSIDIEEAQAASQVVAAAFFSSMATLRVKLARSITLGNSLADMLMENVPLEQSLADAMDPQQRKWARPIANTIARVVSVTFAVLLSGALGIVHSALRGSHLFVSAAINLAKDKGLLEDSITMESVKAKVLLVVMATLGFLWQASHREAQPFPLNIVMLPFTFVESFLQFFVSGLLIAAPA